VPEEDRVKNEDLNVAYQTLNVDAKKQSVGSVLKMDRYHEMTSFRKSRARQDVEMAHGYVVNKNEIGRSSGDPVDPRT